MSGVDASVGPTSGFLAAGNATHVLRASAAAARNGRGVLAVVLETDGSTYVREGAMALFDGERRVGWLSGGCLEPELALRAFDVERPGETVFVEIDTRADEDLFSGSALGCRGRLRIALLPLRVLPRIDEAFARWLEGGVALVRSIGAKGAVELSIGEEAWRWTLPTSGATWTETSSWRLPLARAPELTLFGAGPETPYLLGLLDDLGWLVTLVERRPRWRDPSGPLHRHVDATPLEKLRTPQTSDAALVMHHNFELDRETLDGLAATPTPFIGLLGPRRRRDDLFKLLTPAQRASLEPRLHSPVGLAIGGEGPQAIALSIAAELQAWRSKHA
jgi:xanthine dehydrogenase accessory factor